jgi:hypothetical protein
MAHYKSRHLLLTLILCLSFITLGCSNQAQKTDKEYDNINSVENQKQNKENSSLADHNQAIGQEDIIEDEVNLHVFTSQEIDELATKGFEIDKSTLIKYTGEDVKVVIPKGITTINNSAFERNHIVKEIVFPEGVSEIFPKSFSDCINLEIVKLPNSLQFIGISAFYNCTSLTSITIPKNVSTVGYTAFYSCTSLGEVVFEGQVHNIGSYVFKDTPWIEQELDLHGDFLVVNGMLLEVKEDIHTQKEITIPEGVEVLSSVLHASSIHTLMASNKTIETINLPDSLKYISSHAMACKNLSYINGGKNILSVAPGVFSTPLGRDEDIPWIQQEAESGNPIVLGSVLLYWRNAEGKVEIPEGVTQIAAYAFKDSKVTQVIIPEGVNDIGPGAFMDCSNLTQISLPYGLTAIKEETFSGCSSLSSIQLPDSISQIQYQAFYKCTKLEAINLDTVTELKHGAFSNCENLVSITLSERLITLEENVFTGCVKLTIYGYPDSVIEQYAYDNDIPFEYMP